MKTELRPFWNKFFNFNWLFGLVLIFAICTPRFILTLNANTTANYNLIGLIMVVSAITPFVFLTRYGRQQIGIVGPISYRWMFFSFPIGVLISTAIFALGYVLYSNTNYNWYVYIGQSYNVPPGIAGQDKLIYFLIFAVSGMTFSPIGEELFFRGIVHTAFARNIGDNKASIVDGSAFALTHLAHFGIVYVSGVWKFLLVPSILWVLAMFLTSIIFFQCRKRTGSILGAIICHAGFNLAMIYFIFYHL